MKKVALSLIALLAVGTFAFAEDVAVEKAAAVSATLAADAKVKFGVDLDTKTTGFSHSEGFDLELVIIPESDSSKSGTGDVYGTITIEDVKIAGDTEDGTDSTPFAISLGDIVAKIVFPNGYFKINENTDPGVKYGVDGDDDNDGATIVADDAFYTFHSRYGSDSDAEWKIGDIAEYSGDIAGSGVELYYALPSLVGISTTVASNGSWATNNNNAYEGAVELSLLAVEKLTLKAKGYYGAETKTGFGGSFAYDLGVAVPFADVNYITEQVVTNAAPTKKALVVDFGSKLPLVDGFNAVLAGTYATKENQDKATVNSVFTATLPTNKLLGPAGLQAGVKLTDLLTDTKANKKTEVYAKVSFDLGGGVGIWTKGSFNNTGADTSDSIFVKAGVDAAVFPLATLGAEYDSSDLGGAKTTGDQKAGQVFVYAKVAY